MYVVSYLRSFSIMVTIGQAQCSSYFMNNGLYMHYRNLIKFLGEVGLYLGLEFSHSGDISLSPSLVGFL